MHRISQMCKYCWLHKVRFASGHIEEYVCPDDANDRRLWRRVEANGTNLNKNANTKRPLKIRLTKIRPSKIRLTKTK